MRQSVEKFDREKIVNKTTQQHKIQHDFNPL